MVQHKQGWLSWVAPTKMGPYRYTTRDLCIQAWTGLVLTGLAASRARRGLSSELGCGGVKGPRARVTVETGESRVVGVGGQGRKSGEAKAGARGGGGAQGLVATADYRNRSIQDAGIQWASPPDGP